MPLSRNAASSNSMLSRWSTTVIREGTAASNGLHLLKVSLEDIQIQHQARGIEIKLVLDRGAHPDPFGSNIIFYVAAMFFLKI